MNGVRFRQAPGWYGPPAITFLAWPATNVLSPPVHFCSLWVPPAAILEGAIGQIPVPSLLLASLLSRYVHCHRQLHPPCVWSSEDDQRRLGRLHFQATGLPHPPSMGQAMVCRVLRSAVVHIQNISTWFEHSGVWSWAHWSSSSSMSLSRVTIYRHYWPCQKLQLVCYIKRVIIIWICKTLLILERLLGFGNILRVCTFSFILCLDSTILDLLAIQIVSLQMRDERVVYSCF